MGQGMEPWRARLAMGLALFDARRFGEALDQFQVARRDKPGPRISLAVARCYEALNKPGLAIQALLDVPPRQSGLSEEEVREYYFSLGNLYAQTQNEARAAEAYRQSLAVREEPAVTIRLARMERLLGRPEEALALLRRAQAASGLELPAPLPSPSAPPRGAASAPASPRAAPPQGVRTVQVVFLDNASSPAVLLKGVGPDVRASALVLDTPHRLVLDLPGEWRAGNAVSVPSEAGPILRVRTGRHPDSFRVVLDQSGAAVHGIRTGHR